MKKFFRYLLRDQVDFFVWLLTVEFTLLFFIKCPDPQNAFTNGNTSGWLVVLCLFIFGSCIWTKGEMMDTMKKYIKDPMARQLLYLDLPEKAIRPGIGFYIVSLALVGVFFALLFI